jgi:hypothetical protein
MLPSNRLQRKRQPLQQLQQQSSNNTAVKTTRRKPKDIRRNPVVVLDDDEDDYLDVDEIIAATSSSSSSNQPIVKRPKSATTTTTSSSSSSPAPKRTSQQQQQPSIPTTTTSSTKRPKPTTLSTTSSTSAPLAIDILTGKPITKIPNGWCSELGGELAGKYAQALHCQQANRTPLNSCSYFSCFRLLGSVTHEIPFPTVEMAKTFYEKIIKDSNTLVEKLKQVKLHMFDIPWSREGDPLRGGVDGRIMIRMIVKQLQAFIKLYGNTTTTSTTTTNNSDSDDSDSDDNDNNTGMDFTFTAPSSSTHHKKKTFKISYELMTWCAIAEQFQQAGGAWKCPLIFTSIPRTTFQIQGKIVSFRAHVYTSRLLFYLIADKSLCDLLKPLEPVGEVIAIETLEHPDEETFSYGLDINSTVDRFSVRGILLESENVGYFPASQPKEIALTLKEYQRHTLQWMLDQEALPNGLNGCYWETRSFTPGTEFSSAQDWAELLRLDNKTAFAMTNGNTNNEFFISPILGELRLEKPPLVRGGLLCEEMGMGKTLECVSLIIATRQPEFLNRVKDLEVIPWKEDAEFDTDATLIVVPPPLIAQWRAEIEKSVKPQYRLKVAIWLHEGDSIDDFDQQQQQQQQLDMIPITSSDTITTTTTTTTTTRNTRSSKSSTIGTSKRESLEDRAQRFKELCKSHDIIITTYRTVELDVRLLQRAHWRRLILDEMQEIRSATTSIAKSCETLSSNSRWMVSGTPFYSGINDLNGLLNFLGIIPFSLSDSKDGFWGERLRRPLERRDDDALLLLHTLLSDLMMRHSKSQVYVVPGQIGQSILTLPSPDEN